MAETYYSLTDIVKHIDNLVAEMPESFFNGIWKVRNTLYRIPAADVVPVVRCRECKHLCVRSGALGVYQCALHGDYPSGEYFCADGERKDGDEE